ncbi:MAG: family 78 glycoside hydrolase catalytic domain [Prolixibacteraceae bacterium]|nr:family 78 glycoside hydrolase catalytic domain [Prolixibacteraceae bacterium]
MIKPLIETTGIFSIIRLIGRFFNNAYFGWLRCCCITMLCFYCVTAFAGSPQAPSNTKIIDNFSSLGIDQSQPRFAWILHDKERGQIQTAYQVMVVTKTDNFENSNNVVWNSGKQLSNEQYGIVYSGKPLLSTTQYWWKVRTWNKDSVASPWSTPVSFVTGFLRPGDWAANTQWIRLPKAVSKEVNPLPMFRKEFTVSKKVSSAWLYISGLGQFNSFLNGAKIGDNVIDPAWTDYSKTVNYVTFDLTSKLRTGKNAIGVMLGNGLFARKAMRDFGPLVMIAQLHINFADGTSTDIVSDNTWKVRESPYTLTAFNATEHYDARLAVEGWDSPGLDDREWKNAVVAKAPEGKLIAQSSPPVTARKTFEPVKISSPAPGILVYDFGQNMSGTFDVVLRGQRGAMVTIFPGEATTADGRIIQGRTSGCLYTLNGKGDEHWRLSFSSIGFRYLEFRDVATKTSASTLPVVGKVNAQFVYTASRETGSFRASDQRYNQIFDMVLNGLRSNMISIHTDGPNYERLGWQEVVHTLFPGSSYYFDLHNLYSKIVEDVKSAQRVSGLSPSIAPNYWSTENTPSRGVFDDSPAWGASMIALPWQLYQVYGDSSVLRNALPNMKKYLAYLKTKETPAGVVSYGLGDWMAPGGTSVPNVEGAIYVMDTKIMHEATKLFKTQDASYFKDEYERVRAAYNLKYYDQDKKTYLPASQANLSMPLAFGIVPEADRKAVMEQLVKVIGNPVAIVDSSRWGAKPGQFGPVLPDHITTGDIGTTYLWRSLGDAGQADLVQKMIMQEERPSYWSMIKYGFTTLPENWNYPKTRSNNHDMYAGIFEWFFRSLGGISAIKPGFEEISLKPEFPVGLESVSTSAGSVRGLIRSSWTNENGQVNWKVTIPVNSTASVYIPYSTDRTIAEGGKRIWVNGSASGSVPGLKLKGVEIDADSGNKYVVWTVGSGDYEFKW